MHAVKHAHANTCTPVCTCTCTCVCTCMCATTNDRHPLHVTCTCIQFVQAKNECAHEHCNDTEPGMWHCIGTCRYISTYMYM